MIFLNEIAKSLYRRTRRSSAAPPSHAVGPTPEPFSFSMLHPQQYSGLYPYLQVRNVDFSIFFFLIKLIVELHFGRK